MDPNARNAIGAGIVILVVLAGVGLSLLRPAHKHGAAAAPARGSLSSDVARLKNAYFSKDGDPDSASPLKNKAARADGE